ncbi:MAG TPA: serine protease [Polyangium sp.]|nr:serine protease [Polyangium sp.]
MRTRWGGLLSVTTAWTIFAAFGSILGACGGSPPPPSSSAKPAAAPDKPAAIAAQPPKLAPLEPLHASVPTHDLLSSIREAPLATNPVNSSLKTELASLPEGGKGDVRENYRAVAPATVIIRTPTGLGTGVIINHTGWILTNNHVIEGGEREDFRIKVSVEMGKLDKSGAMERSNKLVTAYVHKADPVRDLAIIKLEGSYKDLPFIRPAPEDPAPGEPVASLGHAGSGLVWAIKDGEVAAVGKLSTHLSQLVGLECGPGEDSDKRLCERKKQMMDGLKKVLDHDKPLQVIQSTCPNWPGDSGGPLVNRANALVGLNSFGYGNQDNRSTFHVHISEIRTFLAEIPTQPADIVPDPWFDGGEEATVEDANLDGHYDVLRTEGRQGTARFFDIDHNSLSTVTGKPDVSTLYGKRSFDAEVIFLALNNASYAWYDTDNDGKFDVMLFDEGSTGRMSRGFRIQKNGRLGRDDSLGSGTPMIRPDLMPKKDDGDTLARLGTVTLGSSMVAMGEPVEQTLPDPLLGGGHDVELSDSDRDGQMDTMATRSVYSRGFVFDIDQLSLGTVTKNDAARELLESKSVDAEASIIAQGTKLWVYYDRNDDGVFDLVAFTPRIGTGVAMEAYRIDKSGAKVPAPEFIGRKIMRPKLLEKAPNAAKLARFSLRTMPSSAIAIDDALGSFPDPLGDGGVYFSYGDPSRWSKDFGNKTGWDKAILVSAGLMASSLVVDIDKDSKPGTQSASQAASSGKFKAEFGFVHRDGVEWTYYDTDQDGKYDLVFFNAHPSNGTVERAYRLDASGNVSIDPSLEGGKMVRPSVFTKKATAAQFKKLAAELFQSRAIES